MEVFKSIIIVNIHMYITHIKSNFCHDLLVIGNSNVSSILHNVTSLLQAALILPQFLHGQHECSHFTGEEWRIFLRLSYLFNTIYLRIWLNKAFIVGMLNFLATVISCNIKHENRFSGIADIFLTYLLIYTPTFSCVCLIR